jgi:uncharacterized protein
VLAAVSRTVVIAFVLSFVAGLDVSQAAGQQMIEIVTRNGVHVFSVELAENDEERARGLMFRTELPEGHGMLFDFQREQEVSFWMKNTPLSLDIIFIRSDGTIRRIAADTTPFSLDGIPSGGPVRAVLEVIAGTAKKLGIQPGDKVAAPILR